MTKNRWMKNNSFAAHGQRGAVLIVALILLVLISILGIWSMQTATTGEQTINGIRTNAVSQGAAEIGLRFCEEIVKEKEDPPATLIYGASYYDKIFKLNRATSPVMLVDPSDANAQWRAPDNWKNPGTNANLIVVTDAIFKKSGMDQKTGKDLKFAPQCIIEQLNIGSSSYLITARGIGNDADYTPSTGVVASGSETWLQSVLTPKS